MSCDWDNDWGGCLDENGDPCYTCGGPGGGGGGLPGGSGGGVVITGGGTTYGGNTLNQVLQSILSGMAILNRAPYVPTSIQPAQQPIIYQQPAGYNPSLGAGANNFGGSLQNFITKNSTPILIGGGLLVLMMMKPPVSRSR